MADCPAAVRLLEGGSDPPEAVAYRDSDRVDRAHRTHLRSLFEAFEDGVPSGATTRR